MSYPEYLDQLQEWMGDESYEVLVELEDAFRALAYEGHQDIIHLELMREGQIDVNDALFNIRNIYREAMDAICQMQGVTLASPENDNFIDLVRLTTAITILGTQPMSDTLLEFECEDYDDDFVLLCQAAAHVSELSEGAIMSYISDVDESAADQIRVFTDDEKEEGEAKGFIISSIILNRFKAIRGMIESSAIEPIVDYIRNINKVGVHPDIIMHGVFDDIIQLNDPVDIYNCIWLVAAASNYSNESLKDLQKDLVESLHLPLKITSKVLTLIDQQSEYKDD